MGRVIWPILIVAVVVIAVVVSASGQKTRTELEYLDEMRGQVAAIARSGSSVADVMTRLRSIDREEFTTGFDLVTTDLDTARVFAEGEPPTESLIPVWSLYRQAVTAWHRGVTGLSTAILVAADRPQDTTIANDVADGLADIRAGDILYQDLQTEFEQYDAPEPVSPLGDITLMPAEGGLASLATSYVLAARATTNSIGLRPGLGVSQIVAAPAWQVSVAGDAIVPATETIVFSAVVTNDGNVASSPDTLTLRLVGGAEPVIAQKEVPALQPGGQVTVSFDTLAVLPETPYEVSVTLDTTNLDSNPDDNALSVRFTVNPA